MRVTHVFFQLSYAGSGNRGARASERGGAGKKMKTATKEKKMEKEGTKKMMKRSKRGWGSSG